MGRCSGDQYSPGPRSVNQGGRTFADGVLELGRWVRMTKILIVDDETSLVEALRFQFRREGYEVVSAHDGRRAVEIAQHERPDLIVLDVMLPELDGFEACRLIRSRSSVPIIMLTAREEEIDRIVGLEIGADDYLTKPFSPRELLARVKAMLRRRRLLREELTAGEPVVIELDTLSIDPAGRRVTRGEETPHLTPREFDLLAFLAAHPNQVFSREALLQRVWGYDYIGDSRTIDVHVRSLREKLAPTADDPWQIETVRGVGYRFAAPTGRAAGRPRPV